MLVYRVFHCFLGVSIFLLCLAGNLFAKTLGLMLFTSCRPSGLFLNFSCDVFRSSFHLILIHKPISFFYEIKR